MQKNKMHKEHRPSQLNALYTNTDRNMADHDYIQGIFNEVSFRFMIIHRRKALIVERLISVRHYLKQKKNIKRHIIMHLILKHMFFLVIIAAAAVYCGFS